MIDWIQASRPKTLIAVLSPIAIGLALASTVTPLDWRVSFLILAGGLFVQIGTNFANDYLDAARGGDTANRLGPTRAVASGQIAIEKMKRATFIMLLLAITSSILLFDRGGMWILLLGAVSALLAYAYSGGPLPLSTSGLSDIFVLLFFGPIATTATFVLQTKTVSFEPFLIGLAPGAISLGILTCNNLRDYTEDRLNGKNTLVVRFGSRFGKIEYTLCTAVAFGLPLIFVKSHPALLLTSIWMLRAVPILRGIWQANNGENYIPFLEKTALLLLGYTILFTLGWII